MMYIKSTLTNQCYEVEEMPKFGGYEVITKAEYDEYWAKRNNKKS